MTQSTKFSQDSLGTRMKEYEAVASGFLMRRTPTIIRIDGKAFHTYAKHIANIDVQCQQPFSDLLHTLMVQTTQELIKHIQTSVFAYTQSDEISLFLRDYDTLQSQSWFNNNIQKITSVSASIATAAFNSAYSQFHRQEYFQQYATFDSRVFNIPESEVVNYFVWRQQDASRNSVQMLGHHHFSQKEMHAKSNAEVQQMLSAQLSIDWNHLDNWKKVGACVYRARGTGEVVTDETIPIFTQDRSYIDRHITI